MTPSEWFSVGGAVFAPSLASLQLTRLFAVIDVDLDLLVAQVSDVRESLTSITPEPAATTPETVALRAKRVTELLEGVAAESKSVLLRELSVALRESDSRVQAAACNEVLGDIDGALKARASFPSVALRLAVFVALFSIAIVVARQESTPEVLANVIALGAGSVMAVLHLRRKISALERLTRRTVDRWVQTFAARVSSDEADDDFEGAEAAVLSRPRPGRRVHSARPQSRGGDRNGRGSRR